jgi:hypothetical protein
MELIELHMSQCVLSEIVSLYFKAMNSVHFCSVTQRSNQMRYFYYISLYFVKLASCVYIRTVLLFDVGQSVVAAQETKSQSAV